MPVRMCRQFASLSLFLQHRSATLWAATRSRSSSRRVAAPDLVESSFGASLFPHKPIAGDERDYLVEKRFDA